MRDLVGDTIEVLIDRDAVAIDALGLRELDAGTQRTVARPSTFIVDAAGNVRYCYVGRTIDDRPKAALLMLGVESLGGG